MTGNIVVLIIVIVILAVVAFHWIRAFKRTPEEIEHAKAEEAIYSHTLQL